MNNLANCHDLQPWPQTLRCNWKTFNVKTGFYCCDSHLFCHYRSHTHFEINWFYFSYDTVEFWPRFCDGRFFLHSFWSRFLWAGISTLLLKQLDAARSHSHKVAWHLLLVSAKEYKIDKSWEKKKSFKWNYLGISLLCPYRCNHKPQTH